MNDRVKRLYDLLMEHEREEQGLIHDIRRYSYVPESRWIPHDEMERRILYVMAEMSRDEVKESIDRYDEDSEELY